jgi:hypothetical protein
MQFDHNISNNKHFSINLQVGILGNYLIGPHISLAQVNGHNYLTFLQILLSGLL